MRPDDSSNFNFWTQNGFPFIFSNQVTFEVIENENAILNQDPVDLDKLRTAIVEKRIGSILSPPLGLAQKASIWQTVIKHIHDETRNTKLKIPIIYGKICHNITKNNKNYDKKL